MKTITREKISEQVYILMKTCGINAYPVNFRELTRRARVFNIEFETYEGFERYSPDASRMFGSRDGAAAYFPEAGFYIIFYNSQAGPQGRINWTIAHEIGHILLGHKIKSETAEREADHFAKLLLCHPIILEKCGIRDKDGIQKLCGISSLAAENREKELKSGASGPYNEWDRLTAELFAGFTSKKMCVSCGGITAGDVKFCAYCGGSGFERTVNAFLTSAPKQMPAKCPVCENQDLEDSSFCKICGLNLKNPCTRCGTVTDISARFCPVCRAETELKASLALSFY